MVDLNASQTSNSTARKDGSFFLSDTCSDPIKACEIRHNCMTPRDQSGFTVTLATNLEGLLYEAGSRVSLFT